MAKEFLSTTYTFTPGVSGVGTVNLSGIAGFDVKYLVAIINQTRGIPIYATGSQTLKYTNVAGTTVTLFFDSSAMVNTDILQVVYQENSDKVTLASIDTKLTSQATAANQTTQTTHLNNIETATEAVQASVASLDTKVQAVRSIGNFYPNTLGTSNNYSSAGDEVSISVDSQGNMLTRSSTDEGSTREPFDGGAIGFSVGSLTLTNGSDVITGADLTILERNSYIKLTIDTESAWAQVLSIDTPTTGRLYFNYTGTGGAAAAIQSNYKPVTGTGGSIGVASSICTIGAGTTINQFSGITKEIDYGPLTQIALVSVSQRIVNQNIYIGLQNSQTTPTKFARFNLSGTVNTLAVFETTDIKSGTPAGADIETSTFTLPDGLTTATSLRYKIEVTSEFCRAYVNDKLVAQHFNNIPAQYNIMDMVIGTLNGGSAPATNTNVLVDSYSLANYNSFKVSVASDQEKVVMNRAMPITYGPSNVTANNTNFFVIDCSQFACVGLYVSSIGGGATIVFQESNDITFVTAVSDVSANAVGTGGGTSNFVASVSNVIIPVLARYLRVRTSAYTSGTITCTAFGYQQEPFITNKTVTTTYNGTQTVTANATCDLIVVNNTDNGAGAVTVTGNEGTGTQGNKSAMSFFINTSVVSGTNPTCDWEVQTSPNAGTTWFTIYQFARMTSVNVVQSPILSINGDRFRLARTIGGTTPSFTRELRSIRHSGIEGKIIRAFYNRTILPDTLNSVTNSWLVEGAESFSIYAVCSASTTPSTMTLQISEDDLNWADTVHTITTIVGAKVVKEIKMNTRFARLKVTTVGTGNTLTYVSIYGVG